MNPASTLAPEPLPIDVIVEYLNKEDPLAAELWKYCVEQWQDNYYAFDPENYFSDLEDSEEDNDSSENDNDADAEDDPASLVEKEDSNEEATIEVEEMATQGAEKREQLALYAPYLRALSDFWTSMVIFTEDNPVVPEWNTLLESITKYIAFVPVDRDRLIRHVQRLNRARQEAERLRPVIQPIQQGTALFDIKTQQFK